MASITKPPQLVGGDKIAIFAGSSAEGALFPRRRERGMQFLRALGFEVVPGNSSCMLLPFLSGSIAERAETLNRLLQDSSIACIMSCIGGNNTNSILDEIDFDALRRSPKILVGYSDFSAILLAAYTTANCVTFHGPALMPQFGSVGGPDDFTLASFKMLTGEPQTHLTYSHSDHLFESHSSWDSDAAVAQRVTAIDGPFVLRAGSAVGRLIVANLEVLLSLHGTRYFPDTTGAILCVEEGESSDCSMFESKITALNQKGITKGIAGLLFGRLPRTIEFPPARPLSEVIQSVERSSSFPIGAGFDFGHTDPQVTMPIGVNAALDCTGGMVQLTLLESSVTVRRSN